MTAFAHFRPVPPILAAFLLSACALSGSQSSLTILAPQVDVSSAQEWSPVDWTVQVQRPVADQLRDSDRVLVRSGGSRLQVYPGLAWLDNVPDLLQAAMVKTLTDTGVFAGVGRAGELRTRFGLATEIRQFELADDGDDLSAVIVLQATLLEQRSARPLAQRVFRHRILTTAADADGLVQAFERGLSELMQAVIPWVLDEGRASVSAEQRESS